MPSLYIQTFGCQMNTADSDTIQQLLSERGFVLAGSHVDSDLIIVNTCSVREAAEKRALARIREFANLKKTSRKQQRCFLQDDNRQDDNHHHENCQHNKQQNDHHHQQKKSPQLWVTGCTAERLGDKIKERIKGVDLVIGATRMENIESIIEEKFPKNNAAPSVFQKTSVSDFIPVIRGCDNFCAYCVVPYVRGREQSVPYNIIEETVRKKIGAGIKEITLLGQNVNSYNHDGVDFPALLSKISNIDGLARIRFTTSHPKDFTEKLLDVIASNPKIAKHIHLPMQAGSDRVLSMMNRKYTSSHYRRLIEMIKTRVPNVDITTDILVGFPGETDAEFRETLSVARGARFTTAFMFAYSPREGTAAASLAEELGAEEKNARLSELISVQTEITREIYNNSVGAALEVLVTDRQEKRDRLWMGQDAGCKRVLFSCENAAPGMIFNVRAVRSSGMTLIAEPIAEQTA